VVVVSIGSSNFAVFIGGVVQRRVLQVQMPVEQDLREEAGAGGVLREGLGGSGVQMLVLMKIAEQLVEKFSEERFAA
jgi:hypothetical protein